eukprot:gene3781-6303_t
MRLQLVGRVISTAETMQKTAKVEVIRFVKHSKVGKVIRNRKVYLVHDEESARMPGDIVRIEECRPLSKRKRFTIIDILKEEERMLNPINNRIETRFSPPQSLLPGSSTPIPTAASSES